jgi:mRNA interferase RelE/StbE
LAWTIEYDPAAQKQLRKLDRHTAQRIVHFLDRRVASAEDPRQLGDPLTGSLSAYWRFRVGDYRIICSLEYDLLVVLVVSIGHRSDVYR